MIVEYIRYTIDEARREAFEGAYGQAEAILLASPHCLGYELARCLEEPSSYTVRIAWDSVSGHLEGFRASPGFRPFFEAVRPFYRDIAEMCDYQVLRSGGGGAHEAARAADGAPSPVPLA